LEYVSGEVSFIGIPGGDLEDHGEKGAGLAIFGGEVLFDPPLCHNG